MFKALLHKLQCLTQQKHAARRPIQLQITVNPKIEIQFTAKHAKELAVLTERLKNQGRLLG